MTWPPVDLCCSESSEDMSSPSGASSTSTLSSSSQQTIRSCAEPYVTASPQLFTDYMIVREELEYLLLREDQGPQPFNYIPFHTFMSHEHREFLVQSINNVSFLLCLITANAAFMQGRVCHMVRMTYKVCTVGRSSCPVLLVDQLRFYVAEI